MDREMRCPYCRGPMFEEEMAYTVELEDGRKLQLEDVPTWVCETCDYTTVDEAVIATVEDLLEHLDEIVPPDEEE